MLHRQLFTKAGHSRVNSPLYRHFASSAVRLQDDATPPFYAPPSSEGRVNPRTVDIDAILPPNNPRPTSTGPRITRGLPPLSRPGFRPSPAQNFEGEAPRPIYGWPRIGGRPKPKGKGKGAGAKKGAATPHEGGRPRKSNWEPDPPAEQVEVEYVPAVITADALAADLPATLVSSQGAAAVLRRGVPVEGGDMRKWSVGKWERRDKKREKVARSVVEGEYESPRGKEGLLGEVKRMVVVNGSYNEKARGTLLREVEGRLPALEAGVKKTIERKV